MSKRRAETWPGRVRRSLVAFLSPARPGPARPGQGRRRERNGKDGLDDGRDHLCL